MRYWTNFFRKETREPSSLEFVPENRLISLLNHWEFQTVIDAGAHNGTWSRRVISRISLLPNPVVALIDPITEVSPENLHTLQSFSDVKLFRVALGAERSTRRFKIASNSGESSSFLELGRNHIEAAPWVVFEDSEMIDMVPLDELLPEVVGPCLLKLDLQGFELEALEGALRTLVKVEVVVIEASLVETYIGGPTLKHLISFFELHGFELIGMTEGFSVQNLGPMIQMDAVFARNNSVD
jgi:FkbM family methyltransferase